MKLSIYGLAIAFVGLFAANTPASAADIEIDWELRYPFRLFAEYPEDVAMRFKDGTVRAEWNDSWAGRRNLYVHPGCMASETPVLCSEEKLGPKRVAAMRAAFKPEFNPEINSEIGPKLIDRGLRYDWEQRAHFLDSSKGGPLVVKPGGDPATAPAHAVWLRLKSATLPASSIEALKCRWVVDGGAPVEGPCSNTKHTLKRGEDPGKASSIAVEVVGRSELKAAPLSGPSTVVKEMIIVGLGDSFASGEGNPDFPAQMSTDNLDALGWPERLNGNHQDAPKHAAMWVDRNCHRSMQSPQARAVIQLAAKYPKREFAFIGVSCSGAEIYEGVLGSYAGTRETSAAISERWKAEPWRYQMSQINQVLWALCASTDIDSDLSKDDDYKKAFSANSAEGALDVRITCKDGLKRPVDAVLLSIGGNDAGFSRSLLKLLVKGWADYLGLSAQGAACLVKGKSAPECKSGWKSYVNAKCQFLSGSGLSRCQSALETSLEKKYARLGKVIAGEFKLKSANRIVIAQYPDPTRSEKEQTCGHSSDSFWSQGLERWPGETRVRSNPFDPLSHNSNDPVASISTKDLRDISKTFLTNALQKTISSAAPANGWQIADSHVRPFLKHGFCARLGNGAGPEDHPSLNAFRKKPLPAFNSYAVTARWFRNVNDAFMVQNSHPLKASKSANVFTRAAIETRLMEAFGAFHPNGLGAAAIADAYYKKLVDLVEREQP